MSQPGREPSPERAAISLARHDSLLGPQLIIAGAILLDLALPDKLTIGPVWLLPGLELLALIGLTASSPHPRVRHSPWRRRMAMGLTGLVTAANSASLVLICHFLLKGVKTNGRELIGSGIVLWVTNVLLFAAGTGRSTGAARWPGPPLPRGGPISSSRR